MAMSMLGQTRTAGAAQVTLGPVLFNWQPETWRDFYFRIADEAPVDTVYLGEVICSKRTPLFVPFYEAVTGRLRAAGKAVVFSTLAEVALKLDRQVVGSLCAAGDAMIEANDASALFRLRDRAHHVGPFLNVYNEEALGWLAAHGARNFCVPAELPAPAIAVLCDAAQDLGVTVEALVFGRLPLALSARCYHARAHGRSKDNCLFVCENDPDGLELKTLEGRPFLAVNGVQTLSCDYLNLVHELPELQRMGVRRFRLSPHSCDMVAVASVFSAALAGHIDTDEAAAQLDALKLPAPFSNGFYYGKAGYRWTGPTPG
jgi:collagenase-like PrtC family protease